MSQNAVTDLSPEPVSQANSTADRVIEILLLFEDKHPTWSIPELMARTKLPRSTLYRYLGSLRKARLLTEHRHGIYKLGPRVQLLANVAKASVDTIQVARAEMLKLSEMFNETVLFNERVDYDIVTLERIESRHRLRLTSTRGSLLPWPATVSSKLLLAYAPAAEKAKFWAASHVVAYTPKTIVVREALEAELAQIRRQGHAYSDEERDEGVIGVAVPIMVRGQCQRCLSIVAPKFRVSDETVARMRTELIAAARVIAAA